MSEHARKHAYATAAEVAEHMRISRKTFARHVPCINAAMTPRHFGRSRWDVPEGGA